MWQAHEAQPEARRNPGVAVFDADSPPALAFIRSLGRRGVPLTVYSPRLWNVARASRYVSAFRRCPEIDDAEKFGPWLEAAIRSGEIQMVAPTSDQIVYYVSSMRQLF